MRLWLEKKGLFLIYGGEGTVAPKFSLHMKKSLVSTNPLSSKSGYTLGGH